MWAAINWCEVWSDSGSWPGGRAGVVWRVWTCLLSETVSHSEWGRVEGESPALVSEIFPHQLEVSAGSPPHWRIIFSLLQHNWTVDTGWRICGEIQPQISKRVEHIFNTVKTIKSCTTRYSCLVNEGDTFVLIGGAWESQTKVSRYNIDGWVEDLADLSTPRYQHGCGHFTNSYNQHVSLSPNKSWRPRVCDFSKFCPSAPCM